MEIKKALIVTDGTETIDKAAAELSAALPGFKTSIRKAQAFEGTDLLPAHVFFIGCEEPDPPSFAYLDEMLQHINLSGRTCGVFSTDSKAIKYLTRLLEACGATVGEPLLIKDLSAAPAAVQKWVQTIPESNF